jgi:hypothetical protein
LAHRQYEIRKRKLRDELEKVTLGLRLAKPKTGMARHIPCIVNKTRCSNIQTEINIENISKKKSLISNCEIKVAGETGIWSLLSSKEEKWDSME